MEKNNREMNLTKEEKRSSLEAQFWNDNPQIDTDTPFMKKIDKICKNVFKNNE